MKVALVHDFLSRYGDPERVLEVLHRIYPNAPVFTAFVDDRGSGRKPGWLAGWDIRPTLAQRIPNIAQNYQSYQEWLPYFWESLDLSAYDLIISSSADYLGKAVLTRSDTLHICYCHTPPRSLWESQPSALWYRRWYEARQGHRLRQFDFCAAQRVDRFVTNSDRVARRIAKFYRRRAEVIPPPVSVAGQGEAGTEYYLYVGPLTEQQRVDLAVRACTQLNRPLWILGSGKESDSLRAMAGKMVRFLDQVPQDAMPQLFAGARALIYPTLEEDFGFAVVEAMGYGVPVIASALSGMREIVLDFRTGLLFPEPTVESLCQTILKFEGLRFYSNACIQRAEEFAEAIFISKFQWFVTKAIDDHKHFGPLPALDDWGKGKETGGAE